MKLTPTDKIKINKYVKEHAEIFYLDMCDVLGKKVRPSYADFTEYFTEYMITEFREKEKIYISFLSKVVTIIKTLLEWSKKENKELNEDILDKIRNLGDLYEEFLIRTSQPTDQYFKEEVLDELLKTINELYPSKDQTESNAKYINKIAQLEKEIKDLNKKITEITKLHENLQANYDKKATKLEKSEEELNAIENDIRNKQSKIKELNTIIEKLKREIENLNKKLENLTEENEVLLNFKEQSEKLSIEIEVLNKKLEKYENEVKIKEDIKIKHSEMKAIIYEKLLLEKVTTEELLSYLKKQKIDTNKEEINTVLKEMKTKINIESKSFSLTPTHKVTPPIIDKDSQFTIELPKFCNYYDIMIVSDFHIKSIDNEILRNFDNLNNYCSKNGINLILNLGDFYNGNGVLDYQNAQKNISVIDESILKLPKTSGIYHAILGGNHDKNILKYGFCPIKMLADERDEFINLGYTHSTINLSNNDKIIGKFDIHHPDNFDFSVELNENGMETELLETYLKNIYKSQRRNRNDSYIDIIGHTHKSQFNFSVPYYYVPPFLGDTSKRGACHLRIYFDDEKQIKYMVFMPLNVNKQPTINNEIIYQKTLTK